MTNSKTYQDYWFVAKGDQAFPTGNIITNKISWLKIKVENNRI